MQLQAKDCWDPKLAKGKRVPPLKPLEGLIQTSAPKTGRKHIFGSHPVCSTFWWPKQETHSGRRALLHPEICIHIDLPKDSGVQPARNGESREPRVTSHFTSLGCTRARGLTQSDSNPLDFLLVACWETVQLHPTLLHPASSACPAHPGGRLTRS